MWFSAAGRRREARPWPGEPSPPENGRPQVAAICSVQLRAPSGPELTPPPEVAPERCVSGFLGSFRRNQRRSDERARTSGRDARGLLLQTDDAQTSGSRLCPKVGARGIGAPELGVGCAYLAPALVPEPAPGSENQLREASSGVPVSIWDAFRVCPRRGSMGGRPRKGRPWPCEGEREGRSKDRAQRRSAQGTDLGAGAVLRMPRAEVDSIGPRPPKSAPTPYSEPKKSRLGAHQSPERISVAHPMGRASPPTTSPSGFP